MPSSQSVVIAEELAGLHRLKYRSGFRGFLSTIGKIAGTTPYLIVLLVLVFLWQIRAEGHLTPESGLGYALGIAGVAALLLLLSYPLRKRVKFMRGMGSTRAWFRLHMFLGFLSPALILAHCGFSLGSTNSSIALASMLVVSGSGLLGRYFYSRIHFGLYGARSTVQTLHELLQHQSGEIKEVLELNPLLRAELLAFAHGALTPAKGLRDAFSKACLIGLSSVVLRSRTFKLIRRGLNDLGKKFRWPTRQRRREIAVAKREVSNYLGTVRRTAQLGFFERLFALWHVLHIPLFFLMMLAIIVHIIAVHAY